jgi:cystathionine beta-lyase/cystathionine gamma-synthase
MTHPETHAVHVSGPDLGAGRPIGVPLYQTSIFAFDDLASMADAVSGPDGAFAYSGYANPTVRALEDAVTCLEGGAAALATSTGMAAISTTLLTMARPGDHIIAQRALYGGTFALLSELAGRWGVEVSFISGDDAGELENALRPRSRLLYLETIANPAGHVPDLPALAGAAKSAGLTTVVDNTFATPLLCRPLDHGADVVIHSTTKYLGGHSDVVGGIAVFAETDAHRSTWSHAIKLGTVPDPFAAWLIIRGLKTLALRLRRQCENAHLLARRLSDHPAVAAVHYPGMPGHASHARARRLLSGGFGGVLAFDLAGGLPAAEAFIRSLRLVKNAGSLGGTETVVVHPATTSHRHLGPADRPAAGVGAGTMRLSAGIEHPDDLWADLDQALQRG